MKSISVVCRANEVRSRVIHAYLASSLPGVDIRSFGIDVKKGRRISQSLNRTMSQWGLGIQMTEAQDVSDHLDFVSESDFVIAADADIAQTLSDYNTTVFDLTKHAIDSLHVPEDPLGFADGDILVNNAKIIHCTIRLLQDINFESRNRRRISAIIPRVPTNISYDFEGFVIDARLKHSGEKIVSNFFDIKFDREMLISGQLHSCISENTILYSPSGEFFRPEETLISKEWFTFVDKVAKMGPVAVVTTPTFSGNIKYPDSYLASVLAGRAIYL
jgi:protein-tyrosine-phosphatase